MNKKPIIERVIGYRTEQIFGSGHRDLLEVAEHEMCELENYDIPDTLGDVGYICDECIVSDAIKFLKELYDDGYTECVWLCNSREAINGYKMEGDDTEYEIDKYVLEGICISDLGEQGKLWAYNPKLWGQKEEN